MAKIILGLCLLVTLVPVASGQLVLDSSFADNGIHHTKMISKIYYYSTMTVASNGNYIVAGYHDLDTLLVATQYNTAGDSIAGYKFHGVINEQRYSTAIGIQADGKVVCNVGTTFLTRFYADGTVDSTFGTNGIQPLPNIIAHQILFTPEGKILVIGVQYVSGTIFEDNGALLRYNTNGTPDSTFADNGHFFFHANNFDVFFYGKLLDNGGVLVSGCSYFNGKSFFRMYKFTENGHLDPDFGQGYGMITDIVHQFSESFTLAVQPDQKILLVGFASFPEEGYVARLKPDGLRDSTFGVDGIASVPQLDLAFDMILQPDGKILILGSKHFESSIGSRLGIIQMLPTGEIDTTFCDHGAYYIENQIISYPMNFALTGNNQLLVCSGRRVVVGNDYHNPFDIHRLTFNLNLGTIDTKTQSVADLLVYPNPVGLSTTLKFNLTNPETLEIALYSLSGSCVAILKPNQGFAAGAHEETVFFPESLPSGNYVITVGAAGKKASSVQIFKK